MVRSHKMLDTLAHRLKTHRPRPIPLPDIELRPAAVLVPLIPRQELELLLIRRSGNLRHHAGQIAFPGGARDPGDVSLLDTALREGQEEVGLPRERVRILGRLDMVFTPSGYTLTPFVGLVTDGSFEPCPHEVEEIFTVPLQKLLDPDIYREEWWTWQGRSYPVSYFELPGCTIWGATGRLVVNLLEVGFGWQRPEAANGGKAR
ncbi:MAG: CoA pyrophosphatase [Armatimonadetes bacterium]|nr:CoA pyrophosphatase [Armatimonadota bacterium]